MIQNSVKHDIVMLCVSISAFIAQPTIVQAQDLRVNPLDFVVPLKVSRGEIKPLSPDARYLNHKDSCDFAVKSWGWRPTSCSNFEYILLGPVAGADNVVVGSPNSDGFVTMDDWASDAKNAIPEIWQQYADGAKAQGERLNQTITPVKWLVEPTLVKEKNFLYYAILMDWDGEKTVNSEAILFDRSGYITFDVVPDNSDLTGAELEKIIKDVLSSYVPSPTKSYAEFRSGDKVAAIGAVGVLATALGVKYGKEAALGIFALLLAFLKKGAFVLILLPLMWVGKLFNKFRGKS